MGHLRSSLAALDGVGKKFERMKMPTMWRFKLNCFATLVLGSLSGLFLIGCGSNSTPPTKSLTEIKVSPASSSVFVGANQQFSALGKYSDGSTSDLTSSVTWSSSDSTLASINSSGVANSVAIGHAQITARSEAVSGSAQLVIIVDLSKLVTRFGFVANMADSTLSAYTVDSTSGLLRHNGYQLVGSLPSDVVVEPRGKYVYTANSNSNDISAFSIDSSGRLSRIAGSPFSDISAPVALAVDPSGSFLYSANSGSANVQGYSINPSTGALTPISGSPFGGAGSPSSLVIDQFGKVLYVANGISNNISAYSIDSSSGALNAIQGSPFESGTNPSALALDPLGRFLYAGNSGSADVSVFTVDSKSGALTQVAGSPFPTGGGQEISGLNVTPDGKTVYVSNFGSSSVSALSVNAGGALVPLPGSPFPMDANPRGLQIDLSGRFAYVPITTTCEVQIFSIAADGSLSLFNRIRTRQQAASIAFSLGSKPIAYTPKFVYATNLGSNAVSGFAISDEDGSLTSVGDSFPTEAGPFGVTSDPSGKFLYVSNHVNLITGQPEKSISGFAINADGSLTKISGSPFPAGNSPVGITVDPSGRFLYATNTSDGSLTAFSLDPSTGALTALAGSPYLTGSGPVSVVSDPSGRFVYVANQGGVCTNPATPDCPIIEYRINPQDGTLTEIGRANMGFENMGFEPSGLAADPYGKYLYLSNQSSGVVSTYSINSVDGTLVFLSYAPAYSGGAAVSVSVDPTGAYAITDIGTSACSFPVDPITGELSQIAAYSISGGPALSFMEMDPSGQYVYIADQGPAPDFNGQVWAYKLDNKTGALTLVNGAPFPAGHSTISVAVTGTVQ